MSAKREQVLLKGVWETCKKLERSYGLTGALSAGILAMNDMPAEQREIYVAKATELTEAAIEAEKRAKAVLARQKEQQSPSKASQGGRQARSAKAG